jgi:hypothetical protein
MRFLCRPTTCHALCDSVHPLTTLTAPGGTVQEALGRAVRQVTPNHGRDTVDHVGAVPGVSFALCPKASAHLSFLTGVPGV